MASVVQKVEKAGLSLHGLGVICGLTAGVWLGAAEAPTKLVNSGFSPFAISLCMVAGVFTARWTFPTLLKGTGYVFADLVEKKHLIVWALLAGALWAVANTLTVFAIRDVGLAVAFPMWNANALIGLFWGRVLFRELEGASGKNIGKVVVGAIAIVIAAVMLGFSTIHGGSMGQHAFRGIVAALGASLMWGTMYVPYRKAYLSGMNPLSFVTAFTVGELGTVLALTLALGRRNSFFRIPAVPHAGGVVLVVPRRICLGDRGSVSAVRSEVSGNRAGNSAVEYESALGAGVGRACLRRTRWGRSTTHAAGDRRLGDDDPWSAGDQHSGRFGQREQLDERSGTARVQPLWTWTTTER